MPISTTYGTGGITTSTTAEPYPGAHSDPAFDLFRRAAIRRTSTPVLGSATLPRAQTATGEVGGNNRASERIPAPRSPRRPIYTRVVGGPGVVPGRIVSPGWAQGADFSGYEPEGGYGGLPNDASFGGDPDAEARRRALDAMSFERFQQSSGAAPRGTR